MVIVIDCRMIDSSGIGVYLRGCLPWFIKTNNNFILVGKYQKLKTYESYSNVKIINCSVKPFTLMELLFFPNKIKTEINKADIFFSPYINIPCGLKIQIYTTIHDIIFPDLPELTNKVTLAVRMWFYRRAYKISKKIFTVSNFSKSRIEYYLGTEKPIIVTYSAIQSIFIDYKNENKLTQKNDTIIFIGNIKKHKGLDCLLEAFHLLRKDGFSNKLLIVGSNDNFRSSDKNINKKIDSIDKDAVLFTGFISDEKLMEYLSSAALLVQPSLYEGFCLPPLEAMILGTHALISDIPVLKEVYSDFPVTFFKASDSIDLKEKMIHLLHNKAAPSVCLPEHLVTKYTFEKTAAVILENLNYIKGR